MLVLVLTLFAMTAVAVAALMGVLVFAERTRPPALVLPETQATNAGGLYATGASTGWVQPQA